MGTRLFVGNLPWSATEEELTALFESGVRDCKVITDRETGKSRGFAFVTMESEEDSVRIIRDFNGRIFQGRELRINEAEERPRYGGGGGGGARSFGGGGGGGGPRVDHVSKNGSRKSGGGSRRHRDDDGW